MTPCQQLGAGLRAARKRKKLTQQQLADRMGVSRRTIIRTEDGETAPSAYLLTTWMRTCDVEVVVVPAAENAADGVSGGPSGA